MILFVACLSWLWMLQRLGLLPFLVTFSLFVTRFMPMVLDGWLATRSIALHADPGPDCGRGVLGGPCRPAQNRDDAAARRHSLSRAGRAHSLRALTATSGFRNFARQDRPHYTRG